MGIHNYNDQTLIYNLLNLLNIDFNHMINNNIKLSHYLQNRIN